MSGFMLAIRRFIFLAHRKKVSPHKRTGKCVKILADVVPLTHHWRVKHDFRMARCYLKGMLGWPSTSLWQPQLSTLKSGCEKWPIALFAPYLPLVAVLRVKAGAKLLYSGDVNV